MATTDKRIPTEFRYHQHVDRPANKALRTLLKVVTRIDPILDDAAILSYAQSYYDADPVAEAFVEEVYMQQGQKAGRAMVDKALAEGVASIDNAPDTLKALFAEIEIEPDWLDWDLVEAGAKLFRRWGTHLYSFAGAITLHGYLENSVAKPLAFTGAYTGESANRRFLETASFWIDVSEPGALRPGGLGVKTSVRVRLMHVFVRQRLLQHPGWDLEAWGVPISQGDALLTLMGGSYLPGTLLRLLGYRTNERDIDALLHFWRYVGHLVGVQPRWYPSNAQEALGLMYTAHVKGVSQAGEDARHLAHSYIDSYKPMKGDTLRDRLIKKLEYRLQLGYMSWFIPPKTYRTYGLPRPGLWRLHPLLQAPGVFALDTLVRHSPMVEDWVDTRARRKTKAWVAARLGKRKAEYHAVENFVK